MQAANVAAFVGSYLIEQRELGIASVKRVETIWFDCFFKDRSFVMLATPIGRHTDTNGNRFGSIEMRVQSPVDYAAVRVRFPPRSLHYLRQGRNQRAIDESQRMLDIIQTAVDSNRLKRLTKISNDLLKAFGIKDIGRVRQRTRAALMCRTARQRKFN